MPPSFEQLVPPHTPIEAPIEARSPDVALDAPLWTGRRRPGRGGISLPPLSAAVALSQRAGVELVGSLGLGTQLQRIGTSVLDLELTFAPGRDLNTALIRRMIALDVDLALTGELGRGVGVGAIAGASYRSFNQQGLVIDTMFLPILGGELEVVVRRTKRMSVVLTQQARLDLGSLQLVFEDQSSRNLNPAELRTALSLRFHGSGDLFSGPPTSEE